MSLKIFLIGLPGAGKTTMGLDLAVHLGVQFVDLDQDIEKFNKQTVREIFDEKGEAHFRQLEKHHLEKVINELDSFVMATGGGTPCFFDNLEQMKRSGKVVFINTPLQTIKNRIKNDESRPILMSTSLEALLESRVDYYKQADYTITSLASLMSLFKN
ncbi:MAG: shikimate kinase [Ekhidna sp.]